MEDLHCMLPFSELRYRHYFQRQVYQNYVLFTQIGLIVYASFSILDILALGSSAIQSIIVRILFVVFTSILMHYWAKNKKHYLEVIEMVAFILAGWLINWVGAIALQEGNNNYQNGVIMVLLYLGTVSRMRFRLVLFNIFAISIPYLAYLSPELYRIDPLKEREQLTLLFTIVLLCVFSSYRRDFEIRTRYQQQREVRRQALELSAYSKRLKTMSETDSLSGLKNRHHLDTVAIPNLDPQSPLMVLLMDIDHFKAINDNHGHDVGDTVIQQIADIIQRSLPKGGTAIRYGGEEFLILVQELSQAEALNYANHLRSHCQDHYFPLIGHCTVSIGVWHGETFDPAIKQPIIQADIALYSAKQSGRNCVEIA